MSFLTEQPPLLPKLIALNKRPDDLESVSARFLLAHPILCLAAAGWNQGAIKLLGGDENCYFLGWSEVLPHHYQCLKPSPDQTISLLHHMPYLLLATLSSCPSSMTLLASM